MSIERDNTPANQREWTEQRLEQEMRKHIVDYGGFMPKLTSPSTHGMPDRLVLLPNNIHFFVEAKRWGRSASAHQFRNLGMLLRLGHHAYFIDNLPDFEAVLIGAKTGKWERSSYRAPPGAGYARFYEDLLARGVDV